jgi:PIN like domain
MKDLFPGFYKKSEESLKELWDKGLITFDANVLLSLYRYSDATRKEFFSILKKFDNKIWLTNQAALEYNRNRCEVISDQEKIYIAFQEQICQLEKELSSKKQPPFLSDGLYKSLTNVFKKVKDEVQIRIKEYGDYLTIDPIYVELSELFEGKIGNPFTEEEIKKIISLGKVRYENKIPPGFEDDKTKSEDRKFGDLILWNQILDKAKELKLPAIFITNEIKKDWWWKLKNDKILGPRQELVEEMLKISGMDFHMYSSDRFLEFAPEYLNEKVNKKAIEEIKEFTKSDAAKHFIRSRFENRMTNRFSPIRNPSPLDRIFMTDEILQIENKIHNIEIQISLLPRDAEGTILDKEREADLINQKSNLSMQKIFKEMNMVSHPSRIQFLSEEDQDSNKIES